MNTINNPVLEKLKKILRLADCAGATPGEAEAAMARAKEIAMQHNIDLSMVDHSDPNAKAKTIDVEKGECKFSTTREHPYHRLIARVLKVIFGVFPVRLRSGYAFIGDKDDVAICKEVFPWLETTYRRSYHAKIREGKIEDCAGDRNAFYRGFTDGLLEVNRKTVIETLARQHVDANKYAVVLRNKETAIQAAVPNFFPNLVNARRTNVRYNQDAHSVGHSEGRKLHLNQVGGTPSRPALA